MPVLRSRTMVDENAVVAFLEEFNIPPTTPDYFGNSSGHISLFVHDATRDRATTPLYTGTASEANYEAAVAAANYTTRINVANAQKIILGIEVVAASSAALHLDLRLSNLGDPALATESDWFRQLTAPTYASSQYDADVAQYRIKSSLLATGAKYTLEIPVAGNWACLVLHNAHASGQFKIYADVA